MKKHIHIVANKEDVVSGYYVLGELIKIGGTSETDIPVHIKDSTSDETISCKVKDKHLAIELAKNLYKKIGLYGTVKLKQNEISSFVIEEFYVKEPLEEKGLFYGISKVLKDDKSIKNLLKQEDLSEYFNKVRNL